MVLSVTSKNGRLWWWLLHGLLWGAAPVRAQQKVQVVTRTVEQTLPCPAGTALHIRAEKATLRVQGWDQPTVRVTLRLIARHPERAVAEQELPIARYQIEKSGSVISLMNYFARAADAPTPQSDLRTEYVVLMPTAATLQVSNAYGQTTLADLTGKQQLTQDFGLVTLQGLRGSLTATVRYADLNGTDIGGTVVCEADKSALRFAAAAGRYTLRNRYGSVLLEPSRALQSAFVDVQRTEVKIDVPDLVAFNYSLSATQGTLTVPADYAGTVRRTGQQQQWRLSTTARLPLIRVLTTYAPITLQKQPLLIKR